MTILSESCKISELDYFVNLYSEDRVKRVDGACAIIQSIIEKTESEHAVYLKVKRLIRGLGGSKKSFKQGCYSSVVSFFHILPTNFEFKVLEEIILKELTPGSNSSKLDEGEALFGQILAYGAMIESDYLITHDKDTKKQVFFKIFDLSQKRSYLHKVAFTFLNAYVQKTNHEFCNEDFLKSLQNLEVESLDKLNYLLTISEFSKKKKSLKVVFNTRSFFSTENVSRIIRILKSRTGPIDSKHIFFSRFIEFSFKYPEFFSSFWNSLYDEVNENTNKNANLKVEEQNSKRKLKKGYDNLLLHLYETIFLQLQKNPNFCSELLHEVLNETMFSVLLKNKVRSKKSVVSVLNMLSKIFELKSAPDNLRLNIIKIIVFDMNCFSYDKITGSQLIRSLFSGLSFENVKYLTDQLKSNFEHNKIKTPNFLFFRMLLFHESALNEFSWRNEQVSSLLKLSFSNSNNSGQFRENVNKLLFDFLGSKFPNMKVLDEVLNAIINDFKKLIKTNNFVKFDKEMTHWWVESLDLRKTLKIEGKTTKTKDLLLALRIVLGYSSLLLLTEPETAITNIQDIKQIYIHMTSKEKEMDNDEIQWIEVLIDIILNLLSKGSYQHRLIVNRVFKVISPHLSLTAFSQLVHFIDPSYVGPSLEEDVSDSEKEDDGSDSGNSEDEELKDESSENEEDESDDNDLTANEKLRQELRTVLTGNVSDVESVDLDEMDEEEGKELDAKLSAIFKANLKNKETKKEKKYSANLIDFKMRVLDLLEICSDVCLPLSYWLTAVKPLTDLLSAIIVDKKTSTLKTRVSRVICKFSKAKVILDVSAKDCSLILQDLLEKVILTSGIYPDMRSEISSLIKFILRTTKPYISDLKSSSLKENALYEVVKSSLSNYFISGSGHGNIFVQIVSSCWDGIYPMIPMVVEFLFNSEVKMKKKVEGINIITMFIKNTYYFSDNFKKFEDRYLYKACDLLHQNILQLDLQNQGDMKLFKQLLNTLHCLLTVKRKDIPLLIETENLKVFLSQNLKHLSILKGTFRNTLFKLCKLLSVTVHEMKTNFENKKSDDEHGTSDEERSSERTAKRTLKAGKSSVHKKKKLNTESMAEDHSTKVISKTSKKNKSNKLKKNSKNLRLKAMDDGLEKCSFLNNDMDCDVEE